MVERTAAVRVATEPTSTKPIAFENLSNWAGGVFDAISRRAYEIFNDNGQSFGHELENWLQAEENFFTPFTFTLPNQATLWN